MAANPSDRSILTLSFVTERSVTRLRISILFTISLLILSSTIARMTMKLRIKDEFHKIHFLPAPLSLCALQQSGV